MTLRVGAHISIAGSLDRAVDRSEAAGADCLQIFGSAPQQWQAFIFPQEQIEKFNRKREAAGIGPVFLHAIYLINLASDNRFILGKSIASLVNYLNFGRLVGAEGVIFHIGSHRGRGFEAVAVQISEALSQILAQTEGGGKLIVENSAGAGGIIGGNFAEIGTLLRAVNSPRLAVCLDTAHAFESGYDISSAAGLSKTLAEFDREIGLEKLICIHANDSRTPRGSNRDRHENIGEGEIGLAGFRRIVRHPNLRDLPFIIETPPSSRPGPGDIEILRRLAT